LPEEVDAKKKPKEHELHEAIEKMIVQAKPAGLEPPTPAPERKKEKDK
jgi:hypothetical protein